MVSVSEQWSNFPTDNPIIATTFNFDWEIIESLVSLNRGKRPESIVIVDKNEHAKTAPHNPPLSYLGNTYWLYPSDGIENTFHPKVVFGHDGQDLLLLIGSHNLSKYGTTLNLEITSFQRIPITDPHSNILEQLAQFLKGLSQCIFSDPIPKKAILNFSEFLKDIGPGETKYCVGEFIHSFQQSIIEQVLERIPQIKGITILARTLSNSPYFVEKTLDLFNQKATFLVDPAQFNVNVNAKSTYQKYDLMTLRTNGNRPLHAKMYIFHTDQGDWVLYGSPNFTESALGKSVKDGGNVEAAWLLPPTKNWNWKNLFDKSVGLSKLDWNDLYFAESSEDNKEKENRIVVQRWGYETIGKKGIIFCPGLPENTKVRIQPYGLKFSINAEVKNGKISFDIPSMWIGPTRYEITDDKGKVYRGDLNRTGAIIPKFENESLNEQARLRYWYFLRRLNNPLPKWVRKKEDQKDPIDFPIPSGIIWVPGQGSLGWDPVSHPLETTKVDSYYPQAKKRFEDVFKRCSSSTSKSDSYDLFVREFLNSLDLIFESMFFSGLESKNPLNNLGAHVKDVCSWLNLPCGNDNYSLCAPNFQDWDPYFCEPITESMIEKWREYGPKVGLDVAILFNYYLYFQIKGIKGFNIKTYDAVIVTNRHYQIWKAFERIIGKNNLRISRERILDNRVDILSSYSKYQIPSNINELERCLMFAYENCKPKLKKMQ